MDLTTRLDSIVEQYDLNTHPFYEEWRRGSLPVTTLATYAEEYGQLVALMPEPWSLLNDPAIAQEERDHMEMWDGFAKCLGTRVPPQPGIDQTRALVETVKSLFASRESAIGALYAFEVQQPETAQSKLAGLLEHYPDLDPQLYSEYFVVHSRNHHESVALVKMMHSLDDAGRETAINACEHMCRVLWDALTGIHGQSGEYPAEATA
jgi:pyrroloquinoline-quinone synthase